MPNVTDPLNFTLLKMSPEFQKKADNLREVYKALSVMIKTEVPAGREQSIACTNLETSLMYAIKQLCLASPQ